MRPILCLIVAASLFTTTSYAQADPASQTSTTSIVTPTRDWAAFQAAYATRHIKIQIFTESDMGRRHDCRLRAITADSIICKHLGGDKTFAKDEINVVSIENPAERTVRTVAWSFLAASGASAYGAYALASVLAASIPFAFLAFALLCSIGAIFVGDNNESTQIYVRP